MKTILPTEAKKRMEQEKGIILLDVRTKDEYSEEHIPNSKLIPLQSLGSMASAELPDKNATIFVYCKSGGRSAKAVKELMTMGYTNVFNMGGIMDWSFETIVKK